MEFDNKDVITIDNPVHDYFGLSYANYYVVPRSLLQSMPAEWQHRFVDCLDEMEDLYSNQMTARYSVRARDDSGKFIQDPLSDYQRGRRRVVPNKTR